MKTKKLVQTFVKVSLVILTVLFVFAYKAKSATVGSITLSGTVPKVVSITVTGTGPYAALDLATTQTNTQVASVVEQSNDLIGYSVTIASANAGSLKNGTIDSLAYTAKYNGTTFTLSTTPVTVTNVTSQTGVVSNTKSVTISYTGKTASSMVSGSYTDTLTFTISAH